eukprot:GHVQ01000934.1.p1 GENE.GHVQ01000934.1~~GHVQ01000934.1.p1  ORF type:complete len:211 (+),score=4.81 GHVQ01000934.1:631-1263(+)
MIKFTKHGPRICVCASRASHETEYAIRLWDLVDNRYMRYFPLAAQVCRGCGLSLHAAGDLMSVCCVDSRVRVYNLSQDTPIATIMSFTPHPVAAFDNRGLVLVCFLGRAKLHFFDARKLTQPEFQTIDLHEHVTKETDERVTVCSVCVELSVCWRERFSGHVCTYMCTCMSVVYGVCVKHVRVYSSPLSVAYSGCHCIVVVCVFHVVVSI